jgi:hypothetical protein
MAPHQTGAVMTDHRDHTNRGVLFKNDRKQSDKQADYKGSINVNGEEFWLDAWINESKSGAKYMSLSIKPKKKVEAEKKPAAGIHYDDEIPFAPEWRG